MEGVGLFVSTDFSETMTMTAKIGLIIIATLLGVGGCANLPMDKTPNVRKSVDGAVTQFDYGSVRATVVDNEKLREAAAPKSGDVSINVDINAGRGQAGGTTYLRNGRECHGERCPTQLELAQRVDRDEFTDGWVPITQSTIGAGATLGSAKILGDAGVRAARKRKTDVTNFSGGNASVGDITQQQTQEQIAEAAAAAAAAAAACAANPNAVGCATSGAAGANE
jgi:hypothetical protein